MANGAATLRAIRWGICAAGLLLAGCAASRDEGPPTVPLAGKIVMTKGGAVKTLADHSIAIQLQSVEQPAVQAFGEILEDGSFSVVTQLGDRAKPGVIPGTHRVRLNADDTSARFIAPKFLNFKTSGITITAPSDKQVVVEVWK